MDKMQISNIIDFLAEHTFREKKQARAELCNSNKSIWSKSNAETFPATQQEKRRGLIESS